jgi:predicted phage terminase large subunit-like protein
VQFSPAFIFYRDYGLSIDLDKEKQASELRGSLLLFTRFFYKYLTGRDFIISCPHGRESHHITISKAYTQLFREQKPSYGLLINIPPGYGKSVMTSMFVAWCYAQYPDCNFLYISYSHELAASHTSFIKQIMSCKMYKYLFDVSISSDTRAKDHFMTEAGGVTAAFGSSGAITGRNAGSPGLNRFSGCVVIDDAHKPNEVHSASIRENVIRNYTETILQRPRDINVPIVFIGQRLHEDDLAAYLMSGKDVRTWETLVLKGIDDAGNALYPEVQSLKYLCDLQAKQPYVFASQIQQNPIPSGGSLFKPEWFIKLKQEPEIIRTFITADTAETSKSYNDATVFSFWGIYELNDFGVKTNQYALHWLDCWEIRVEPKDLHSSFIEFYSECMLHPIKPLMAAIEKKSTGVTLLSVLEGLRGLEIREVKRTKASGSKTERFLELQPIVAAKLISFTENARHTELCINHMSKITANDAHKHDDICDSAYDAVKIALIDKVLTLDTKQESNKAAMIMQKQKSQLKARGTLYGGNQISF